MENKKDLNITFKRDTEACLKNQRIKEGENIFKSHWKKNRRVMNIKDVPSRLQEECSLHFPFLRELYWNQICTGVE